MLCRRGCAKGVTSRRTLRRLIGYPKDKLESRAAAAAESKDRSVSVSLTVFAVEDAMLRLLTGAVVVTVGLVLVGQGVGQDDKKPDLFGRIKEVKKAEEGAKGLGTITITTGKKGEDGKDVTLKVGKKAQILKRAAKGEEPTAAEFSDLKEGAGVAVWLADGKEDVAKKIVFFNRKKKAAN
jgi:hypothetical protein